MFIAGAEVPGEKSRIPEHGLVSMSEGAWAEARRRSTVIGALAQLGQVTAAAADAAGDELGLSRRRVYELVRRHRDGSGLVTEMAPGRSDGGRGGGRLSEAVETVIREAIRSRYLTRQRLSVAAVHREISRACKSRGLPVPTYSTVGRRVDRLHPAKVAQSREGSAGARGLRAAGDTPPPISEVLEVVQIDHTVIDIIVVDEWDRQPIGRPYLTVAIDVFSRCVVGLIITLEAPSAVSVGLCLAQVCCEKLPWLEGMGVEVEWPMSGKPQRLYLDNAAEFKSEALRRGCEQHGIELSYRPGGQPHFGGIVERIIGTAMSKIHELPGTTFSNPIQRGSYPSEKWAVLTLRELEQWMVLAVATYHGSIHSELNQTPAGQWAAGIAKTGTPAVVTSPTAFLIDFLPVIRRTLTRTGFVIDHVHYFSNALRPWVARRGQLGKFVIRRDPRDIGRVWVLNPDGRHYVEVGYRTLSRPSVTLWEHRQAVARLRQQGRNQVDEQALFSMVDQMRTISQDAQKATRRTRRERQRRNHLPKASATSPHLTPPAPVSEAEVVEAAPFADIEEW